MSIITSNPSKPRRTVRGKIAAAVDLTVTPPYSGAVAGQIQAGELLYLTANHAVASLATAGTSNANAASCVGVADDVYPVQFTDGVTGSPVPPGDASQVMVQIYEDGDHLFETTAADVYNAYDVVYLGANGRTISKTATGSAVGYVSPDQRQSAGLQVQPVKLPITGGSGVMIYIRITPALAK